MLCSSSSSSFSSEDGSGSNSDRSSVILGESEAFTITVKVLASSLTEFLPF